MIVSCHAIKPHSHGNVSYVHSNLRQRTPEYRSKRTISLFLRAIRESRTDQAAVTTGVVKRVANISSTVGAAFYKNQPTTTVIPKANNSELQRSVDRCRITAGNRNQMRSVSRLENYSAG